MPTFIPGLQLAEQFYYEAVRPILDAEMTDLPHSAALLGSGSEILGFDTPQSTDHHWGPRLMLFLTESELPRSKGAIVEAMRHRLPRQFRGYSTHYEEHPDEPGTMMLRETGDGPINHRVEVLSVRDLVRAQLHFDLGDEIALTDWLTFPQQILRTLTEGAVYHDATGEITLMRQRLAYFPRDVWLYLLAAGWGRIGQEEAFVGRTGAVGDETGSRVIGARVVRDLMRLCFLMERTYWAYPKWFGTAFSRLNCAAQFTPIFHRVLGSVTWRERERHLSDAYSMLAAMHNALGITDPMPTETSQYHGRPYQVIHAERFTEAILKRIEDDEVQAVAAKTMIGSIDQFSDSTDLLSDMRLRGALKALYS